MAKEYIERDAALDIVNGWREQLIPNYGENDEYVKCLEAVAEHLYELPAADVAPVVRGRWIKKNPYDSESNVKCSACGEVFSYIDGVCYLVCGTELPHYCPNCGVRMEVQDADP